jgi:hypothetical protein
LTRLAGVAIGVVLGAGCATRSIEKVAAPQAPARIVSPADVISAYDSYCEGLSTLNGTGDLDVKDFRAGKQRKLGVRLLAAREGRLYVKGSVLLVTGLEVVSNGERFWFQVPSKNTVWTGRADAAAAAEGAQNEPYYALRPRDVNAALLPEPIGASAGGVAVLDADALRACVTLSAPLEAGARQGIARRRACVDRATLTPRSLSLYDERGDLSAEVTFADVRDGAARRLDISRPREGYLASFVFEKLIRNEPVPERAFAPRPAEGYKVVEVTP